MDGARGTPSGRSDGIRQRGISRVRLGVLWILTAAPLALGWMLGPGVDPFAGVSMLALCGLVWISGIGLPRRVASTNSLAEDGPTNFADELAGTALFVPPLAVAAAIDCAQGANLARVVLLGGAIAIAGLVMGDAARRASNSKERSRNHAIVWFVLVGAPPLLLYALESGGAPFLGRAPWIVHMLNRSSPLGILHAQVSDVLAPLALHLGNPVVLIALELVARARPDDHDDVHADADMSVSAKPAPGARRP